MGRRNVLDFIAHHFDAPRFRGLVEFAYHLRIDMGPLLKGSIQLDLAKFAAQGGLRQLRNAEDVVANAVGGALGVENFQVRYAIDRQLNVVPSNANLRRDVDGLLF